MKFDPYDELGLEPGATPEEIDKAFRERAKETHPDAGGDAKDFQRAQRAVAILRNPKKRKHYDETGDSGEEKPEQHPDFHSLTYIGQLIGKLCELPNLDKLMHMDLAQQLRNGVNEDLGHLSEAISAKRQGIARAEKLLGRFKRKGNGFNVLEDAVKFRIQAFHDGIKELERATVKMKRALEILEEFSFNPTEDPNKAIFRHFDQLGFTKSPRGMFDYYGT